MYKLHHKEERCTGGCGSSSKGNKGYGSKPKTQVSKPKTSQPKPKGGGVWGR